MQDTEIWKDIPNYEGLYQVSNLGRVKSFKLNTERVLKPTINSSGYYTVCLYDGEKKTHSVHQLVAMAFMNHTQCGYKLVVDHRDFNRVNNNLDNLEIVTSRQNTSFKKCKSTSEFTGVSWHKRSRKWQSRIRIKSKSIYLGCFATEIEASNAYQATLNKI